MEDYERKLHDLTVSVYNNLWELRDHIRGNQEDIADVYQWLCGWAKIFEDDLYPGDEEN